MIGYLRFVLRRRFAREPATSLLTVAGVALGAGSVVTVQVLTEGAVAAFDATVELLAGDADALVLGHGGKVDESLYPVVLGTEGVAWASPLLEGSVVARQAGEQDLRRRVPLYGVDLLSPVDGPLHPSSAGESPRSTPADGVQTPDRAHASSSDLLRAAASADLARTLGVGVGDTVEVARGPAWAPVALDRVLDATSLASAQGPLLIMDIADAQNTLGGADWISRVNVRFRPDVPADTVRRRLASRLDGRALVSSPGGQRAEARRLLSAFRVNLSALAFTSVFVGLFLVYGTTRASLARRRHETGLLRSLGATRSQVLGATLAEAGVLGVAGAALGVPLGYAVALANLDSVSGTVTDLYLLSAIRSLEVPPRVWLLALTGGVLGTIAGAAGPAAEVCLAPAADLLSDRRARVRWRSVSKTLWRAGWAVLALLLTWFAFGGHRWRHAGFVLAAGIMVWTALAAPAFVTGLCRLAGRSRGFGWRFALGGLPVRLHTSGVAVAGVAVAFAMLVGTTVMVGSFRDTFRAWLDATMQADVYVSGAAWTGATDQGGVHGDLLDQLRRLPGVAAVGRLRGFHGYADDLPVALRGIDARPIGTTGAPGATGMRYRDRMLLKEGDSETVVAELADGAVAVSEPLARRAGVGRGDSILVRTTSGAVRAAVAGVYYQYGTDRGSVSMDLATMETWFGPGAPHGVAIYLDRDRRAGAGSDGSSERARATTGTSNGASAGDGAGTSNGASAGDGAGTGNGASAGDGASVGGAQASVVQAVRQAAAPYPVVVRTHGALRADALRVFDQTFAVTLLLQAMALAVAAAGVALSLLVMAREEAWDTATCRALGATRGQVFRFHLGKGAGLAGIGGVLGAAGGGGLAAVLIYVTNRAYFGWTVQFGVPAFSLAQQCAFLLLTAVAASWWPAFRASGGGGAGARRSAMAAAVAALALAACSPPPESDSDPPGGPSALPDAVAEGWLAADPNYSWSFPDDHGPHFGYKTEWWYFTGVLSARPLAATGRPMSDVDAGASSDGDSGEGAPERDGKLREQVESSRGHVEIPRELGYQFTIFKIGLRPPGPDRDAHLPTSAPASRSRWTASSLLLGHMAVSDPAGDTHVFSEVLYRAGLLAPGEPTPTADPGSTADPTASADPSSTADPTPSSRPSSNPAALAGGPLLAGFGAAFGASGNASRVPIAWSRGPPGTSSPWRLDLQGAGFAIAGADDAAELALSLVVRPTRPVVFQGPNGYSRKSAEPGRASMYYSRPRLATTGTVQLGAMRYAVAGASWMDHEFSSEPLAPEQVGWDWLSLRMNNGVDVTVFQLRRSDGRTDYQAATLATSSDPPRHLPREEWSMAPGATWTSPATGATYPVEWTVALPGRIGRIVVRAAFSSQENVSLRVANLHYWEGMVRAFGPDGLQVGQGYLEMTGYGEGSRPAL